MGPLWKDIDTNWQRVETQLRHLQWILDTGNAVPEIYTRHSDFSHVFLVPT